ncbi:hypothetical protein DN820_13630 [Stutzerimonas nosocomialis]|uniref:DUF2059 domain-containing protein n=1 Tax=Stutzerimonas nosocomialis TaxID=1056496 RepID=A0A5R9QE79_9GAMM|nr:DUF2059 domain-containing protein [Stutzerimonas nosocomialis]TLX63053.1 hypothetical protein DN820_13630 [Stutzerimonas nosocomialis]
MSRLLTLMTASLLTFGSLQVHADARSHQADAERFLQMVQADKLAVPVYGQVQQMFAQRFAQLEAPADKQATLERYVAKADAELDKAIGWPKLKPEIVELYTSTFTEQELKELIAFYESPIGKKMMARLPELNARSAQLTQVKLEAAVPPVNKLLEDMTAELQPKKP